MTIEDLLREELQAHGELRGTEQIALDINVSRKSWMIEILRRLASRNEVIIIPSIGGRGKKTIYIRNRNSPGQPRKMR
jgi:hypothetical protein